MNGDASTEEYGAQVDKIGLHLVPDVEMQYYLGSGDGRDKPPQMLEDMISRGQLGVKTGQGFPTYPNPAYEQLGWLRKEPPWDTE